MSGDGAADCGEPTDGTGSNSFRCGTPGVIAWLPRYEGGPPDGVPGHAALKTKYLHQFQVVHAYNVLDKKIQKKPSL